MPFINIAVAGGHLTAEKRRAIFSETTRLMAEIMHKKAELTAVRIDQWQPDTWAIGARPVAMEGQVAVHMDIKVTAGTNSAQEKADMIQSGMEMLKTHLGATPEASYIVIHELDANAWGYDGQTQLARAKT